jgi:hypothetical protein
VTEPARRTAVPPAVLAIGSFADDSDYQVAFETDRPEGSSPLAEDWIRSIFEETHRGMRWFLLVGWAAIGCRLRPRRAPSRVLGWEIERASPEAVVTVVSAWTGLTSRLVVSVEAGRVTLSSFVRFTGRPPVARTVWAATVPLHERILPHLLTDATRRARSPTT